MSRGFYWRLAISNIRKNARIYLPYYLTCVGCIMMFFILATLGNDSGWNQTFGGAMMELTMGLGSIVIGLFSIVFLFYTNSFLIKRRKQEFGLYQMLGMEKRHLARVILYETILLTAASFLGGFFFGFVFSKLLFLFLVKLSGIDPTIGFSFYWETVWLTIQVFLAIYGLNLIYTLFHVVRLKPVELLKEASSGEREPKVRWLLVVLGIVALGGGYYLALTTEDIIMVIPMFFIAVILVMIGTYSLFTAGSIAFLKALKKNKHYYYHPNHFTNVSGLLYRMKQNAVGLANICILSTCVLVMVSTTVSLYVGIEDSVNARYPKELAVSLIDVNDPEMAKDWQAAITDTLQANRVEPQQVIQFHSISVAGYLDQDVFLDQSEMETNVSMITLMTTEDYQAISKTALTLADDETYLYSAHTPYMHETLQVGGKKLTVAGAIDSLPPASSAMFTLVEHYYLVVKDEAVIDTILDGLTSDKQTLAWDYCYMFDVDLDDEAAIALSPTISSGISDALEPYGEYSIRIDNRAEMLRDLMSLYGGLLFLGIFLGLVFVMATVLIIYYKQIQEGYDDAKRFAIMQKVGMSQKEVKKTIHSQVILVFFLPLVGAIIHICFAFKIVLIMLKAMGLVNTGLFIGCLAGTIGVFALMYTIVYFLTARSYYKIVRW